MVFSELLICATSKHLDSQYIQRFWYEEYIILMICYFDVFSELLICATSKHLVSQYTQRFWCEEYIIIMICYFDVFSESLKCATSKNQRLFIERVWCSIILKGWLA